MTCQVGLATASPTSLTLKKNHHLAFLLPALVVCVGSALVLSWSIDRTRFHGDESGWISSAYYYTGLALAQDFDLSKWDCRECGNWGSLNMHLGQWLIGIPLMLDPQIRGRSFSQYYRFKLSLQENISEGRIPPRDILMSARRATAVFGVLCCLLVFTIGYFAYNAWIGALAASLLLSNELFIDSATRAMTDVHYNFFALCFCLAVILLLKTRSKKRILLVVLICGILAGLTCSVKITGIAITGLLFLAALIYMFPTVKLARMEIVFSLILFCSSALSVVYSLNPYFWPPERKTGGKTIVREIISVAGEVATGRFPGESVSKRYPQLYSLWQFPRMFPRWSRSMESQKVFASAAWGDSRYLSLNQRMFVEHANFPLEWIFLGLGLLLYVSKLRRKIGALPGLEEELCLIPLLYFLVNYFFALLFMKLNWNRYYLPTVIADRFLVALGIYAFIVTTFRYLRRRLPAENAGAPDHS